MSSSSDPGSISTGSSLAKYTGFDSGSEYLQALLRTPQNLKNRVFHRSNATELSENAHSHTSLMPTLKAIDLVGLGVGMMLGAGVFVSTGSIAAGYTGPSIIIAFAIAGLSAFLSSFVYAEFAVDLPFAGGAYNFILCSLGEFFAWIAVANLLFTYVLGNAAVMRGFAPYFASLCNQPSDFFTYEWNGYEIDWFAFGLPLLMTLLQTHGMRDSATINLIITCIHLIIMIFIIVVGFTQGKTENFTPFAPFGWRQVFNGAAQLFFSFIGFDAVATTSEEVINPQKDMPVGILGSVSIVTAIYILMGCVLSLMVPFDMIDPAAPFTSAFQYAGLDWAKYIVAIGALLGILTGVFVGILGAARILTSSGRQQMLPPFVSLVGEKHQTPWVATWIIGLSTAVIGLFTSFDALIDMVSIGVLLVFWMVALASIWRRNYVAGQTSTMQVVSTVGHLVVFIGLCLAFSITWVLGTGGDDNYIYNIIFFGLAVVVSFSLFFLAKPQYTPEKYVCPLFPFVPLASMFLNIFLMAQLSESGFVMFGWWTLAVVGMYLVYSMPASWVHDREREEQHAAQKFQGIVEAGSRDTTSSEDSIPVKDNGPMTSVDLGPAPANAL